MITILSSPGLFCLIGCLKQPEEKKLHVQMEERINGKKTCSYEKC